MNLSVIKITGGAGAGKTLLARWIEKGLKPASMAVLEYDTRSRGQAIQAFAQACGKFDLILLIGDWPQEIGADLVITVARGTWRVGDRYNNRPPGTGSLPDSARPGERSPMSARPDPTRADGRRCNTGTRPSVISGLLKQIRAARELLSPVSEGISVFPSLRLLNKFNPDLQP